MPRFLIQAADSASRTAQSAKEQAAQGYETGKQKGRETAEVAEQKAGQAAQATKETAQQVGGLTTSAGGCNLVGVGGMEEIVVGRRWGFLLND